MQEGRSILGLHVERHPRTNSMRGYHKAGRITVTQTKREGVRVADAN